MDSSWTFLNLPDDISLSATSTDVELLSIAKTEVLAVCTNARRLLNKNDITMSDFINYFLDGIALELLDALRDGIPVGQSVSGCDFTEFIKVLAYLSIYGVTSTTFFDSQYAFLHSDASKCDADKFTIIMNAFKKNFMDANLTTWNRPFSTDTLIRRTELSFSRTSSDLAFIPSVSILSVDDDQYRLTSALSETMGFTRVNNSKKAFGLCLRTRFL